MGTGTSKGTIENQCGCSFRICCCEQRADRPAFRHTKERSPLGTDGIQHRAHVVAPEHVDDARQVGTRSDKPMPRLSNTISLVNAERRLRNLASTGSSHASSTCVIHPGRNTRSRGPLPTTW